MDTANNLRSTASRTFTSIQTWAQTSQNFEGLRCSETKSDDNADFVAPLPRPQPSLLMKATGRGMPKRSVDGGVKPTNKQSRDDSQSVDHPTLLQKLTWPLIACNSEVAANLPRREQLSPHMKKVRESVSKAVDGDIKGARDSWKVSVSDKKYDILSTESYDTYDTLREDIKQIRRLESWNTSNTITTTHTNGTHGTGVSLGTEGSPVDIRIDDDGNAIDPYLLSKTQQRREKRRSHRRLTKATREAMRKRSVADRVQPTNLLQELTWSLTACNSTAAANLPRREQLSPHIKKVRESVSKAINWDIKGARDLWKVSVSDKKYDILSTESYDTFDTLTTTGTNGTTRTNGSYDICRIQTSKTRNSLQCSASSDINARY